MRRLMYVTLGFGASCALFAYCVPRTWILSAAAVCALLCILSVCMGRRLKLCAIAALVLLGGTLGTVWFSQFYRLYLNDAAAMDTQTANIRIHITDYSDDTDYGSAADGRVVIDGKRYRTKVYLDGSMDLAPGMELQGVFRFRVTTPDGEKAATYHQGRGVFLLLYQADRITVEDGEQDWQDKIAVLRQQIKTALESAFPEDAVPFAKALLLGDTRDLSYEVDSDLKISGIRHVAAVSGLHVSILFALVSTVTFRRRFLMGLLGFPGLLLFAALAGFTPSVTRSCLMLSLTLLGLVLEKEYDGPTALSFAVLVMLTANPLTITDVGFQLSVGSVAGIYGFSGRISGWITGLFGKGNGRLASGIRALAVSAATSMSAMTATAPLCAVYFGTVSLSGVVTNLLTLWVISFIFYGILAVCLLGFLWPGAAAAVAWLIAWPIRYVLLAAELMAKLPLSAVYTKSVWTVCWLILVYLLLLLVRWRKLKPGNGICLGILGLCLSLLLSWYPSLSGQTRFTMLDVGQGQCLLVQSEGKSFLVDCGGDTDDGAADIAAAALLSQGITRLDAVIVTHGDRDHAGGIANLLTRVDADLLILPQDGVYLQNSTRGRVIYPDRDITLTAGDTNVSIFVPRFPGTGNEISLCVLFDTEKCDILITGDRSGFGERSLLRNSAIPQVDILVAGHHGSKNSTCQELLDAVRPETVCISASADNSFGHPSPELLHRLKDLGCGIRRTDLEGDIVIRR